MRGVSVIPKTARKERLASNLRVEVLDRNQWDEINRLGNEAGPIRYLDPKDYVGFDVFDEHEDQPVEQL